MYLAAAVIPHKIADKYCWVNEWMHIWFFLVRFFCAVDKIVKVAKSAFTVKLPPLNFPLCSRQLLSIFYTPPTSEFSTMWAYFNYLHELQNRRMGKRGLGFKLRVFLRINWNAIIALLQSWKLSNQITRKYFAQDYRFRYICIDSVCFR